MADPDRPPNVVLVAPGKCPAGDPNVNNVAATKSMITLRVTGVDFPDARDGDFITTIEGNTPNVSKGRPWPIVPPDDPLDPLKLKAKFCDYFWRSVPD